MKVLLVLMAVGFVAVSSLRFEDLLDLPFKRQAGSDEDSGMDGDDSSGDGEGPDWYRRDMCMFMQMGADKDFFHPINVNNLNKFLEGAKNKTAGITAEAAKAVAAAEAILPGTGSVAEVMADRIHAFESNTRAVTQSTIGQLMGGLLHGVGMVLATGIQGFQDSRKCNMLRSIFVSEYEKYDAANMTEEEYDEQFGQDTALHASISDALLKDIKCLHQDVDAVIADLNKFITVTPDSPSKDVVMTAFGYLYDFARLARHFREILCEGQMAAKYITETTGEQGSGSGKPAGGKGSGDKPAGGKGSGGGKPAGGKPAGGKGSGGGKPAGGKPAGAKPIPKRVAEKRAEMKLLSMLLRAMDKQN